MHTGIALIQEPWILKNEIKGLNGAGTVFRAAGTSLRTCIVTRGLKAELIPRHTSKDLTNIRIKVVGDDRVDREVIVASSYLPCRDAVPSGSLKTLVEDENLGGLGLIIGCDSNSHHALWGSRASDNRDHDLLEF